MAIIKKIKDNDLLVSGELNERLPAITSGLVAHYPFDETLDGIKPNGNLLPLDQWVVGVSGSQGIWSQNGTTAENKVIWYDGPFGGVEKCWASLSNDATSDDDGGWNTAGIPIDSTKKYRFSVWVKRENGGGAGTGTFYFGVQGNTVNDIGGGLNGNPYFQATGLTTDIWYLCIGHVHPAGYAGGYDPNTGIYTLDGTKVASGTDYRWVAGQTTTGHRSYLYYSTKTDERQYWFRPVIEMDDGYLPTPAQMCQGQYNTIKISNNGTYTLTPLGVAVEEGTTNLSVAITSYGMYNNLGYPMSATVLTNETFRGFPIMRTTTTLNALDWYGGMFGSNMTYTANTWYTASICWRPHKEWQYVQGQYSNIAGWQGTGTTEILENGWRRTTIQWFDTVNRTDNKFWTTFADPNDLIGSQLIMDWAAPQIEAKQFATSPIAAGTTRTGQGSTFLRLPVPVTALPYSVSMWVVPSIKNGSLTAAQEGLEPNIMYIASWWDAIGGITGALVQIGRGDANINPNGFQYTMVFKNSTQFDVYINNTLIVSNGGYYDNTNLFTIPMFTIGGRGYDPTYSCANAIYRNVSFYNKIISTSEIKALVDTNTVEFGGGIRNVKVYEKMGNVPTDMKVFPLGFNAKSNYSMISPITESNTIYEKGAAWAGPAISNLVYRAGSSNGLASAVDITSSCLKYDLGNGFYKYVNKSSSLGVIRIYCNNADLTNGATYGCAIKFMGNSGTVSFDWCDQTISSGVNSSTEESGQLYGFSTRGTYDATYRFLDINLTGALASIILYEPQVTSTVYIPPFYAGDRATASFVLPINVSNANFTIVGMMKRYQTLQNSGTVPSNEWEIGLSSPNSTTAVLRYYQSAGVISPWIDADTWAGKTVQHLHANSGVSFAKDKWLGFYIQRVGATLTFNLQKENGVWYTWSEIPSTGEFFDKFHVNGAVGNMVRDVTVVKRVLTITEINSMVNTKVKQKKENMTIQGNLIERRSL